MIPLPPRVQATRFIVLESGAVVTFEASKNTIGFRRAFYQWCADNRAAKYEGDRLVVDVGRVGVLLSRSARAGDAAIGPVGQGAAIADQLELGKG